MSSYVLAIPRILLLVFFPKLAVNIVICQFFFYQRIKWLLVPDTVKVYQWRHNVIKVNWNRNQHRFIATKMSMTSSATNSHGKTFRIFQSKKNCRHSSDTTQLLQNNQEAHRGMVLCVKCTVETSIKLWSSFLYCSWMVRVVAKGDINSRLFVETAWIPKIEDILPKGPYPPCIRMADRALLAGYPRNIGLHLYWYAIWYL